MNKIVFVTSTLTSGGAERVISLLANSLSKRGHIVEIVNLNKHIVFYNIVPEIKLVFAEDEVGTSLVKKCLWFRKYIKRDKPDIVIPFMEAVYCVTLLSLIGVNVPVLSSERIDPRKSPFIRNVLRRLILPLTDWLVVQTEEIKAFYPNFIRKKTSVIYNPVSEIVFHLEEEPKANVIISVGKLDYQKNQKLLISSFAKISHDHPSWNLVIYGEGPLRKQLESQIISEKMQNKVFLPGRCETVIQEMNRAKVFAFSSDFEGMSNAILEAVCVGLPVVTTNVSGATELVKDGAGGFVVPIKDEQQMAVALSRIMSDEILMAKMAEYNKQQAHRYQQDVIVNQWETLINCVVNR